MIKRIENIIEELPIQRNQAKENTTKSQESQKKQHDKKGKRKQKFQIGDKVLYYNAAKEKWKGPYYIYEVIVNGSYKLKDMNGKILKTSINGELLKEYFDRKNFEPMVVII